MSAQPGQTDPPPGPPPGPPYLSPVAQLGGLPTPIPDDAHDEGSDARHTETKEEDGKDELVLALAVDLKDVHLLIKQQV